MTPYPLAWPENIPRWKGSRQTGAFKTTLNNAMTNVSDALRRFGTDSGKSVSDTSSSAATSRSAVMRLPIRVSRSGSSGTGCRSASPLIATRRSRPTSRRSITSSRRAGTSCATEHWRWSGQRFTGFTALPPPEGKRAWRVVLALGGNATAAEVETSYRRLAAERHPDRGGTNEAMSELNQARTEALKELS